MAVSQKKLQLSKRIADKPETNVAHAENSEFACFTNKNPALWIETQLFMEEQLSNHFNVLCKDRQYQ